MSAFMCPDDLFAHLARTFVSGPLHVRESAWGDSRWFRLEKTIHGTAEDPQLVSIERTLVITHLARDTALLPEPVGVWGNSLEYRTVDQVMEMLIAANRLGMIARYGLKPTDKELNPTPRVPATSFMTPLEAIKACHCLSYQCNETGTWHETECQAAIEALCWRLHGYLDGYNEAPWDWTSYQSAHVNRTRR